MTGMKITVDAAMRARDVSHPRPEHEELAQATELAESGHQDRPVSADPGSDGRPDEPLTPAKPTHTAAAARPGAAQPPAPRPQPRRRRRR
jgi:hypothetical protein